MIAIILQYGRKYFRYFTKTGLNDAERVTSQINPVPLEDFKGPFTQTHLDNLPHWQHPEVIKVRWHRQGQDLKELPIWATMLHFYHLDADSKQ